MEGVSGAGTPSMHLDLTNFDAPVFKLLAKNDTGSAKGHQGGMVIPARLAPWFPQLDDPSLTASSTAQQNIQAELAVGDKVVALVEARYQLQTWGGTRSPERRLTRNLGAILRTADAGDIVLVQRSVTRDDLYRLTLIPKGAADYREALSLTGGQPFGSLAGIGEPVRESVVDSEQKRILQASQGGFQLFDEEAGLTESRTLRVARSRAFQREVIRAYSGKCSICGHAITLPSGRTEAEAGHIVPRSRKGADDLRNGMAFCRSHHWAFDAGVISVTPDYRIVVAEPCFDIEANAQLTSLDGKSAILPSDMALAPAHEALAWHTSNVFISG